MRSHPHENDHTAWATLELDELVHRLGVPIATPGEHSDVWPPKGIENRALIADAAFFSFTAPEAVRSLELPPDIRADLLRAAALPGAAGLSAWHRIAGRIRLDACGGALRRLLPPLYANLRDHIDESRLAGARTVAVEAWCHGQRLQHGTRDALDALRGEGAELLPIGGAALVALCHGGDWSHRWTSRVRLLVRQPVGSKTEAALASRGWDAVQHASGDEGPRHFERKGLKLDLHTRLLGGTGTEATNEPVWRAQVPSEGLFARTLCPTDHLLYVCSRADTTGASLSWAVDAMALLRAADGDIDWGRLRSMASAAGAGDLLRHGLLFLRTHLDAAIPGTAIPPPSRPDAAGAPGATRTEPRRDEATSTMPSRSTRQHLLRAATLSGEPAAAAWHEAQASGIDVGAVGQPDNRLVPAVYANLRKALIPRQELSAAEPAYIGAWTQNQRLLSGTRGALEALLAARVDFLLLKGVALIPLYFHDWGARWMTDIDVWVRSANLLRAVEVLRQEGWEAIYPSPKFAGVSRILHSCALRKPGVGELDLHWHLLLPCCWEESDDEFWESSVPITVGPVETRTLCPTDQLFHVCAHAESSRVYNDDDTDQWVVDALAILDGAGDRIDWPRLVALASSRRMGRALGLRLTYLERSIGAAIPRYVTSGLARLPLSPAERIERASLRQQTPRVRRLLNLMSQFLRLRRQRRFRPLTVGPIRFLRDYWHLDRTSPLSPMLVRKMSTNVRALLPTRKTHQRQ